jgi:4-hydroxymandelate oxidase
MIMGSCLPYQPISILLGARPRSLVAGRRLASTHAIFAAIRIRNHPAMQAPHGTGDPLDLSRLYELDDFEQAARAVLDATAWAYLAGGAGTGRGVAGNVDAFRSVWLRPRILGGALDAPSTGLTLLGHRLASPVLLAPTSPLRLFHPDAEVAITAAAATAGTVAIVSTDSHHPLSAVNSAGAGHWWFQLYTYRSNRSKRDTEATIAFAEESGATALVVTVDANHPARRIEAQRSGFRTPPHVDFGTLRTLGILTGEVPADTRLPRRGLDWHDLAHIRGRTSLPIVVKGVLHPADARLCAEAGVEGIVVSNHGGRQLDAAMPSLLALREIAAAAPADQAILFDGGIRSGLDVIVALALGAHAVCVGRPYVWGLALAGQAGVEAVLALLRSELDDGLRQLGVAAINQLTCDYLVSPYTDGPARPVVAGQRG